MPTPASWPIVDQTIVKHCPAHLQESIFRPPGPDSRDRLRAVEFVKYIEISCRYRHAVSAARHLFETMKHAEAHGREAVKLPITIHLIHR